jgi:Spy/CpxP family protein refolding chaperone
MAFEIRRIARSVVGALIFAGAAVATAQNLPEPAEPRGDATTESTAGMGGMGGVRLLRSPHVQADLKLTPEQRAQVAEFLHKLRLELTERAHGFEDLTVEERRQKAEELDQAFRKEAPQRAAKLHQEIEALLQPEQQRRFRQLELRYEGPWVLLRPEVVEALALTDEQQKQIDEISRETQEAMRDVFRESRQRQSEAPQGAPQVLQSELMRRVGAQAEQARRDGVKRAGALLTRDQAKKLLELMGPPLQSPLALPPQLGSGKRAVVGRSPAENPPTNQPAAKNSTETPGPP